MIAEISTESYEDTVKAINQTFTKYYPSIEKPKISAVSFHFASAIMYEATEQTRKFSPAMALMKSIPSLNPANAAGWLAKLPFSALYEMWSLHNDIYKVAFISVFKKFQLPYQDLVDGRIEEVTPFLAQYNSVLGTSYK